MLKQQCYLCTKLTKNAICDNCNKLLPTKNNRCITCAIPINTDAKYCGICLENTPIINKTYALYCYSDAMVYLIEQFKYQQKLFIGKFFANKVYSAYKKIINYNGAYDLIIPVPLHKKKIRKRGFNQSLELLATIKEHYPNIVSSNTCLRNKNTPALASLKLKARLKHIKGAFSTSLIKANKVLIIDDVLTSGATTNELAKTITTANPNIIIDVICLARAELN